MHDHRLDGLQHWLTQTLAPQTLTITPLAGDASFRRYFRVQLADRTLIAMDAPPDKENSVPFVAIARAFAQLGIQVPQIFAANLEQGFLLLSDLGDRLYLTELNAHNAENLYNNALLVLPQIQSCREVSGWSLPHFNRDFILREWRLFQEWVLQQHWGLPLTVSEQYLLVDAFEFLVEAALAQPQVCVHRDYHSRNLLVLDNDAVGVLDFQDAVWGPITYDAVSLLRDCYISWPRAEIERWCLNFHTHLTDTKQLNDVSAAQFMRWFDLLGIQRNLKALGIFARLNHLYKRPNYLKDIPVGLNYILEVSADYPELAKFRHFLQTNAIPQLTEALEK